MTVLSSRINRTEPAIADFRGCKTRIILLEIRVFTECSYQLRHNLAYRSCMIGESVARSERLDKMPQLQGICTRL